MSMRTAREQVKSADLSTPLPEKPDDRHYPVVIFDGLEMRPYWTPEGYKVSTTAKNIRTANAGKA